MAHSNETLENIRLAKELWLNQHQKVETIRELNPNERMKILDQRLGKGLGAKKERARLSKLI